MKKRFFSLFLACCLLCALLPSTALRIHAETYSGFCNQDRTVTWSYDESTKTLTVSGTGEMRDRSCYSGRGEDWHEPINSMFVEHVVIEPGVTRIGDYTFYQHRELSSVSIPDTVTSIGESAFQYCYDLNEVHLPAGLESLGKTAFNNTGISIDEKNWSGPLLYLDNWLIESNGYYSKTLTVKEGTVGIGGGIAGNDSLTEVILPESCRFIGDGTFKMCRNLQKVELPQGLKFLGKEAFEYCEALTSIRIPDGVESIGDRAFHDCKNLKSVTFPAALKQIGVEAFEGCDYLSALKLPSSLEVIGMQAFQGCWGIQRLDLPSTMREIGAGAFYQCYSLRQIHLNSKLEYIGDSAFAYTGFFQDHTEKWVYLDNWLLRAKLEGETEITVRDGTVGIAGHAFESEGQIKVTRVRLPESIRSLGGAVFENWEKLSSINLPEKLLRIGELAFMGCGRLAEVTIPLSVKQIGSIAFGNCSGLKKLTIMNPECLLDNPLNEFSNRSQIVLCGLSGSTAEAYAKQFGCQFVNPYPTQFADVGASSYYLDAVVWASSQEITSGTAAGAFSPNQSCTRGQVVTFLWRAAGKPPVEDETGENPFTDVQESAYYYDAVLWAVGKGVTTGASETTFNPNGKCTRGQVVTFLWRAAGSPEPASGSSAFRDVSETDYYARAVVWAVEKGITNGTEPNVFSPRKSCTRAQVVTFLWRYCGKE